MQSWCCPIICTAYGRCRMGTKRATGDGCRSRPCSTASCRVIHRVRWCAVTAQCGRYGTPTSVSDGWSTPMTCSATSPTCTAIPCSTGSCARPASGPTVPSTAVVPGRAGHAEVRAGRAARRALDGGRATRMAGASRAQGLAPPYAATGGGRATGAYVALGGPAAQGSGSTAAHTPLPAEVTPGFGAVGIRADEETPAATAHPRFAAGRRLG